ncbi:putative arginyl-tRNA--protein transferase [Thermodesulfomicrobium sp. WS]|uniref:arginyltransferase n=1 Tax=Thermodesulfomicrobium sp. WS TaxID=3004129 RepID=UPI00248F8593|nr:arginyltransferase [Thermodesulfomicrobium sp. WS]BDV00681.1 putative arginyl-tRNA--protein transferase [Thermodesulfomicrobium sp. WS]
MILYQAPEPSPPVPCPYLPDRRLTYEHFFAGEVRPEELDWLLTQGWRKFGAYYFRPACQGCRACQPVRVPVHHFQPSKSQRRVLRLGHQVTMRLDPLHYRPEFFELYARHSLARFGQSADAEDFLVHLHSPSCPSMLALYHLGERLVGVSYLDIGEESLSSVYFVFDPDYAALSLGNLSILREIDLARNLGLAFYYLGFVVPGCARMAYKERFRPQERYSWEHKAWERTGRPRGA